MMSTTRSPSSKHDYKIVKDATKLISKLKDKNNVTTTEKSQ